MSSYEELWWLNGGCGLSYTQGLGRRPLFPEPAVRPVRSAHLPRRGQRPRELDACPALAAGEPRGAARAEQPAAGSPSCSLSSVVAVFLLLPSGSFNVGSLIQTQSQGQCEACHAPTRAVTAADARPACSSLSPYSPTSHTRGFWSESHT